MRACASSSRKIEKIRSESKNITRDMTSLFSMIFWIFCHLEYLTILKIELRDEVDKLDDASISV